MAILKVGDNISPFTLENDQAQDVTLPSAGISPDDLASHQAFREKYALNFPLLSDPGHRVADSFGVWGVRKNGSEGILRTTFVLHEGKVARVFEDVAPTGHAREVLEALSQLSSSAP